jgi:hypothetical protein
MIKWEVLRKNSEPDGGRGGDGSRVGPAYGAQLSPTPKKIGLKPSEQNFRGINEVKSLRNEMNGK